MHVTSQPGLDRTMTLADGRTLAWSEWGDLAGAPVVLLHGQPGSRLLCPDLDATDAAGVRLITIDRPGYGRSDPRPDGSRLAWVDDFVELAESLALPPCPIVGWSAGGPYALACGHRVPDRVTVIGLAASPGLLDEVPGGLDIWSPESRAVRELLRRDRAAGLEAITRDSLWYDGDGWQSMFSEPWGADERYRTSPEVVHELQEWLREGARQGALGYQADLIAERDPDGFSAAQIGQAVHVWMGEADTVVSRVHADHLAAIIPRATLVTFPGEGHLFPLAHWGEMLATLLRDETDPDVGRVTT